MNVILTGATGFVGEGVLMECLKHPQVKTVLSISRRPIGLVHPKLKQHVIDNFKEVGSIKSELEKYDACFYCAGISSRGLNELTYTKITYDTTIHFAETLSESNPNMVFNFLSGRSTDSTESGEVMWARVKGKTENALKNIFFKEQYNFRPGFMNPTSGQKNVKGFYKIIAFFWPLLFPGSWCKMSEVGQAMINAVLKGYKKQTLEVDDIKELAKG